MAGSNWISATTQHIEFWNSAGGGGERQVNGFLDTVGIQADGSLWISSEAKAVAWTGAKMMRFGDETNWQQVVQKDVGFLLLKRDGTLWQWGTNRLDWSQWQTRWPTVRAFLPQPLGTNSDWQEIFNDRPLAFARKNDGSVWRINWDWKIERDTNLDQIVSQTVSFANNGLMAWIGKDGTLWSSHRYWNRAEETRQFFQVSKETNWVTTEINWGWLVALKSDGSLWQWHFDGASLAGIEKRPPTRLGLHRDWIGLAGGWDGTVTLAADGSLWFWPDEVCYLGALMKAPKQPQPLGQVPVPAAR
jgi:alpha-tubulin suppressor-like RCC1 family protein